MDSHFYWYLEKDGKKQRKKIEEVGDCPSESHKLLT